MIVVNYNLGRSVKTKELSAQDFDLNVKRNLVIITKNKPKDNCLLLNTKYFSILYIHSRTTKRIRKGVLWRDLLIN